MAEFIADFITGITPCVMMEFFVWIMCRGMIIHQMQYFNYLAGRHLDDRRCLRAVGMSRLHEWILLGSPKKVLHQPRVATEQCQPCGKVVRK